MICLDEGQVLLLLEGGLGDAARVEIEAHLDACEACRRLVGAAAPTGDVPSEPADQGPGGAGVLGRGASVGRYLVLSVLGEGGMGRVHAAYDPELDRRVALKLLRAAAQGALARGRLLREARALGRLSHPNVVQVHDVGEHDGDVFIAMELIDGRSLDAWCRLSPKPTWPEVLAAYVDAARGLSAAHAKGLVHRDVKPSNILRGHDGRVRVVDFGLAAARDGGPGREDAESAGQQAAAGNERLTATGAVLGTPLYMAPEQHQGAEATAASDQYGLCVALHEGLYGRLPFTFGNGTTPAQLLAEKSERALPPPPANTAVPRWVQRALARGLAVAPADRHPSMDALIAALSDDPSARRRARTRNAAIGVAASALVALGGVGWARERAQSDPCARVEQQLEGVWDEGVKGRVRAAFLGTGRFYAEATATLVSALLDRHGAEWASMRAEVCVASRREPHRREVLALRDACLDGRRGQLQALTALFAEKSDTQVLDEAVSASAGLSPIAHCADTEALTARVRPPEDPAVRARVTALSPGVDRLQALFAAGKYREALALGEPLLAEAEAFDFAPLRARVQVAMGKVRDKAGDYAGAATLLRAGGVSAAEGRDDVLAAEAVTALLLVVGDHQVHIEEASTLIPLGRMVVARADDALSLARWLGTEGLVLTDMHRYADADASYERALGIDEKLLGPDHPDVARLLANRGRLEELRSDYPRARASYERALAILAKALDPGHPEVLTMQHHMASVVDELGDIPQALALHELVVAGREKALGPDHPLVASSLTNLGVVLKEMGEWSRAKATLERALAIKEKTLGPDNPAIAVTIDILGDVSYAQGEYPQALALYERALAVWEKALGPAHPDVAYALFGMGRSLVRLGKLDPAQPLLERALAVREKAQGTTHPNLSQPLLGLGQLYLARHRPEQAIPLLERALAVDPKDPEPEILLGLADTLWPTAASRPRARALVERARAYCERTGYRGGMAAATRWLAEHPLGP